MYITNVNKLEDPKRFDRPNYTGYTDRLGQRWGAKVLGFHIEVMDPKTFSSPYHYHTGEEELFLVLEGEAVVRTNGEYVKVKQGDLFFYPMGSEYAHNMYNFTDRPFKFLAVSNDNPDFDTCHYPDSKKRTSDRGILQNDVVVDYFKDEEDPAKYWPDHALRGDV